MQSGLGTAGTQMATRIYTIPTILHPNIPHIYFKMALLSGSCAELRSAPRPFPETPPRGRSHGKLAKEGRDADGASQGQGRRGSEFKACADSKAGQTLGRFRLPAWADQSASDSEEGSGPAAVPRFPYAPPGRSALGEGGSGEALLVFGPRSAGLDGQRADVGEQPSGSVVDDAGAMRCAYDEIMAEAVGLDDTEFEQLRVKVEAAVADGRLDGECLSAFEAVEACRAEVAGGTAGSSVSLLDSPATRQDSSAKARPRKGQAARRAAPVAADAHAALAVVSQHLLGQRCGGCADKGWPQYDGRSALAVRGSQAQPSQCGASSLRTETVHLHAHAY